MAGVVMCPEVRLRHDVFENTCIGAIYKARISTASKATALKHCEVHTRKNPGVYVSEVASGVVRVSSGTETVVWRLSCQGRSEPNVTMTTGLRYLGVPSGCSLSGLDVTYKVMPLGPRTSKHVQLVTWSTELPTAWTERFHTLVNVSELLRDADVWRKANELETEFKHHLLSNVVSSRADYDYIGLAVSVVAGAAMLVIAGVLVRLHRIVAKLERNRLPAVKLSEVLSSSSECDDSPKNKKKRKSEDGRLDPKAKSFLPLGFKAESATSITTVSK